MREGPFEAGSHCRVAARAERVARSADIGSMNAMAGITADAVPRMRRLKPVHLSTILPVTLLAGPVDRIGLAAGVNLKPLGIKRFNMRQSRSVTGFAGRVVVPILMKLIRLRLVANGAPRRSDKAPLPVQSRALQYEPQDCPFSSHSEVPDPGGICGNCVASQTRFSPEHDMRRTTRLLPPPFGDSPPSSRGDLGVPLGTVCCGSRYSRL